MPFSSAKPPARGGKVESFKAWLQKVDVGEATGILFLNNNFSLCRALSLVLPHNPVIAHIPLSSLSAYDSPHWSFLPSRKGTLLVLEVLPFFRDPSQPEATALTDELLSSITNLQSPRDAVYSGCDGFSSSGNGGKGVEGKDLGGLSKGVATAGGWSSNAGGGGVEDEGGEGGKKDGDSSVEVSEEELHSFDWIHSLLSVGNYSPSAIPSEIYAYIQFRRSFVVKNWFKKKGWDAEVLVIDGSDLCEACIHLFCEYTKSCRSCVDILNRWIDAADLEDESVLMNVYLSDACEDSNQSAHTQPYPPPHPFAGSTFESTSYLFPPQYYSLPSGSEIFRETPRQSLPPWWGGGIPFSTQHNPQASIKNHPHNFDQPPTHEHVMHTGGYSLPSSNANNTQNFNFPDFDAILWRPNPLLWLSTCDLEGPTPRIFSTNRIVKISTSSSSIFFYRTDGGLGATKSPPIHSRERKFSPFSPFSLKRENVYDGANYIYNQDSSYQAGTHTGIGFIGSGGKAAGFHDVSNGVSQPLGSSAEGKGGDSDVKIGICGGNLGGDGGCGGGAGSSMALPLLDDEMLMSLVYCRTPLVVNCGGGGVGGGSGGNANYHRMPSQNGDCYHSFSGMNFLHDNNSSCGYIKSVTSNVQAHTQAHAPAQAYAKAYSHTQAHLHSQAHANAYAHPHAHKNPPPPTHYSNVNCATSDSVSKPGLAILQAFEGLLDFKKGSLSSQLSPSNDSSLELRGGGGVGFPNSPAETLRSYNSSPPIAAGSSGLPCVGGASLGSGVNSSMYGLAGGSSSLQGPPPPSQYASSFLGGGAVLGENSWRDGIAMPKSCPVKRGGGGGFLPPSGMRGGGGGSSPSLVNPPSYGGNETSMIATSLSKPLNGSEMLRRHLNVELDGFSLRDGSIELASSSIEGGLGGCGYLNHGASFDRSSHTEVQKSPSFFGGDNVDFFLKNVSAWRSLETKVSPPQTNTWNDSIPPHPALLNSSLYLADSGSSLKMLPSLPFLDTPYHQQSSSAYWKPPMSSPAYEAPDSLKPPSWLDSNLNSTHAHTTTSSLGPPQGSANLSQFYRSKQGPWNEAAPPGSSSSNPSSFDYHLQKTLSSSPQPPPTPLSNSSPMLPFMNAGRSLKCVSSGGMLLDDDSSTTHTHHSSNFHPDSSSLLPLQNIQNPTQNPHFSSSFLDRGMISRLQNAWNTLGEGGDTLRLLEKHLSDHLLGDSFNLQENFGEESMRNAILASLISDYPLPLNTPQNSSRKEADFPSLYPLVSKTREAEEFEDEHPFLKPRTTSSVGGGGGGGEDIASCYSSPQAFVPPPFFLSRSKETIAAYPALDLACGSGRDSLWLALLGYKVVCVEHHPKRIANLQQIAKKYGVSHLILELRLRLGNNLNSVIEHVASSSFNVRGYGSNGEVGPKATHTPQTSGWTMKSSHPMETHSLRADASNNGSMRSSFPPSASKQSFESLNTQSLFLPFANTCETGKDSVCGLSLFSSQGREGEGEEGEMEKDDGGLEDDKKMKLKMQHTAANATNVTANHNIAMKKYLTATHNGNQHFFPLEDMSKNLREEATFRPQTHTQNQRQLKLEDLSFTRSDNCQHNEGLVPSYSMTNSREVEDKFPTLLADSAAMFRQQILSSVRENFDSSSGKAPEGEFASNVLKEAKNGSLFDSLESRMTNSTHEEDSGIASFNSSGYFPPRQPYQKALISGRSFAQQHFPGVSQPFDVAGSPSRRQTHTYESNMMPCTAAGNRTQLLMGEDREDIALTGGSNYKKNPFQRFQEGHIGETHTQHTQRNSDFRPEFDNALLNLAAESSRSSDFPSSNDSLQFDEFQNRYFASNRLNLYDLVGGRQPNSHLQNSVDSSCLLQGERAIGWDGEALSHPGGGGGRGVLDLLWGEEFESKQHNPLGGYKVPVKSAPVKSPWASGGPPSFPLRNTTRQQEEGCEVNGLLAGGRAFKGASPIQRYIDLIKLPPLNSTPGLRGVEGESVLPSSTSRLKMVPRKTSPMDVLRGCKSVRVEAPPPSSSPWTFGGGSGSQPHNFGGVMSLFKGAPLPPPSSTHCSKELGLGGLDKNVYEAGKSMTKRDESAFSQEECTNTLKLGSIPPQSSVWNAASHFSDRDSLFDALSACQESQGGWERTQTGLSRESLMLYLEGRHPEDLSSFIEDPVKAMDNLNSRLLASGLKNTPRSTHDTYRSAHNPHDLPSNTQNNSSTGGSMLTSTPPTGFPPGNSLAASRLQFSNSAKQPSLLNERANTALLPSLPFSSFDAAKLVSARSQLLPSKLVENLPASAAENLNALEVLEKKALWYGIMENLHPPPIKGGMLLSGDTTSSSSSSSSFSSPSPCSSSSFTPESSSYLLPTEKQLFDALLEGRIDANTSRYLAALSSTPSGAVCEEGSKKSFNHTGLNVCNINTTLNNGNSVPLNHVLGANSNFNNTLWAANHIPSSTSLNIPSSSNFLANKQLKISALKNDFTALNEVPTLGKSTHLIPSSKPSNSAGGGGFPPKNSASPSSPPFAGFGIIIISRFLKRSLYPSIRESLVVGGFLFFHTFMQGNPHPSLPNNCLRFGELESEFGESRGFEILMNRVVRLVECGRLISMFIARKLV